MAYTKLFNWLTDLVRNEKIIAARLDAEFDAIAASSADSIHITQASPSGSVQGEYNFNDIAVTSNMTVLAGSPSTQDPFSDHVSSGLKITMDEGASAEGFQIPLLVRLNHEVSTDIWQAGAPADHIVLATQGYSSAADTSIGGTDGAGIYAGSFALYLDNGAVHQHVVGLNPEIISITGSTIQNRVGVRSQSMGDAGARGADLDAAYTIVSLTNPWKDGIVFGEPNAFTGTAPIHTSGSLMSCVVTCTVSSGFNFGLVTATADIFKFGTAARLTGAAVLTLNGNTAALPAPTFSGCLLQIGAADGAAGRIYLDTFVNSVTVGPSVTLRKSRGTAASRSALTSGDRLGGFFFDYFDGTGYNGTDAGGLFGFGTGTISTTSHPTGFLFQTVPSGQLLAITAATLHPDGSMVMSTATGGAKGVGTINAIGVYDDNTLLTCYPFDQAIDGAIDIEKWDGLVPNRKKFKRAPNEDGDLVDVPDGEEVRTHEPLRKFMARIGTEHDPMHVESYVKHWKEKRHLTSMPNEAKFDPEKGLTAGEWIQRLVETTELQAIHMGQLLDRVAALEAKQKN